MNEPTRKAADEPPARELSDETIVNPEREVKLSNGKRYVIEPWGMKQGNLVLERMDGLQPAMASQTDGWNARLLLSAAWDEVIDLIVMTVGVDRAEMEKPPREGGWTFEDVCEVTDVIFDVCILRSDGRGALPSLVALVGKMTQVAARALAPGLVKKPAIDSEPAATSGASSGESSA